MEVISEAVEVTIAARGCPPATPQAHAAVAARLVAVGFAAGETVGALQASENAAEEVTAFAAAMIASAATADAAVAA